MDAIRTVRPIGPWIPEKVKSRAMELSNGQTSLQKRSVTSYQKDTATVQQRISDSIYRFVRSKDVQLNFEIDSVGGKISVKVINKASGEVIREISIKPEVKMDMLKGVICQTIA